MARPDVVDLTERTFAQLPEVYRWLDARQHEGGADHWPLLRYLSCLVDDADPADRFADLVLELAAADDPLDVLLDLIAAGDVDAQAWLTWLPQWAGVTLDRTDSLADQVAALLAPDRFLAGTTGEV